MSLYSFSKAVLIPGSIPFLAICIVVGLVLLHLSPRDPRPGQAWLLTAGATYLLMSSPLVAIRLGDSLLPPGRSAVHHPVDILIVFDGDNRRGRAAEALDAWRHRNGLQMIVVGAPWMRDELRAEGVPDRQLAFDGTPRTTREQMLWVERYAHSHPGQRLALVVSRLQAPRVQGMVNVMGLDVEVRPSPVDQEPARAGWRLLAPSYGSLRVSRDAFYELAACAYYRWRGWMT